MCCCLLFEANTTPYPILFLVTVCCNETKSVPAKENPKIKNIVDDIPASCYHFPEVCITLFKSSLSDTWPSQVEAVPRIRRDSFLHTAIVRFPSTSTFIIPRFSQQPCKLSLSPSNWWENWESERGCGLPSATYKYLSQAEFMAPWLLSTRLQVFALLPNSLVSPMRVGAKPSPASMKAFST